MTNTVQSGAVGCGFNVMGMSDAHLQFVPVLQPVPTIMPSILPVVLPTGQFAYVLAGLTQTMGTQLSQNPMAFGCVPFGASSGEVQCRNDHQRIEFGNEGKELRPKQEGPRGHANATRKPAKNRRQTVEASEQVVNWRERWRRAAWAAPEKWLHSALTDEATLRDLCDGFFLEYVGCDGEFDLDRLRSLARDLSCNLGKTAPSEQMLLSLLIEAWNAPHVRVSGTSVTFCSKSVFSQFFRLVLAEVDAILRVREVSIVMLSGSEVGTFQVAGDNPVADLLQRVETQKGPPIDPRYAWQLISGSDVLIKRLPIEFPQGGILTLVHSDKWPALKDNELELIVEDPLAYAPGESIRSSPILVGSVSFRLLVFPGGTLVRGRGHLGAFVETVAEDVDSECVIPQVRYSITAVKWSDFARSKTKDDVFSFAASGDLKDRGWHDLVSTPNLPFLMGPSNAVCIRASVELGDVQHWVRV